MNSLDPEFPDPEHPVLDAFDDTTDLNAGKGMLALTHESILTASEEEACEIAKLITTPRDGANHSIRASITQFAHGLPGHTLQLRFKEL